VHARPNRSLAASSVLQEEGGSHSDDNKALESYRAARLAQLQAAVARNKYGAVSAAAGSAAIQHTPCAAGCIAQAPCRMHIAFIPLLHPDPPLVAPSPCPLRVPCAQLFPLSRPDFVKEVTEASRDAPVVVLLYKDAVTSSRLLEAVMMRVSAAAVAVRSGWAEGPSLHFQRTCVGGLRGTTAHRPDTATTTCARALFATRSWPPSTAPPSS
jgi:hypothetical protein